MNTIKHVLRQQGVVATSIVFIGAIVVLGVVLATAGLLPEWVSADPNTTTVTVGNAAPTIDALVLRNQAGVSGADITLVEDDGTSGGFIIATTTIDITDNNGCNTINFIEAKMYRTPTSTIGTVCSANDNNCYAEFVACVATTTGGGQCTGGADTFVQYDCGFKVWYLADPTADGEAFPGDIWAVSATTSDGFATTTATNTNQTVEVLALLAHRLTGGTLAYGTVAANDDTGTTNSTTTVNVSGNKALDTDVSCDVFCSDYSACAGNTFTFNRQQHALAPFDWSSGNCTATTSPTKLETVLAKPTATTSAVFDDLSWGIGIPGSQANDDYTSQNTLDPVVDS